MSLRGVEDDEAISASHEIAAATSWSHNDKNRVGLPLGNLTSQLSANVYMNVLDQWVKHELKVKHYLRYADNFVLFSQDKLWLAHAVPHIENFLREKLKLLLHPDKIILKTVASGVDFLGWVRFPRHRVLRRATRRRMLAWVRKNPKPETLQFYLGFLKHGNTFKIRQKILADHWTRHGEI